MRAAGEFPLGLEASGASVSAVRITAASLAGVLTGLGGAYLTTVELGLFSPGVSVGTGFMAIAVAMLGQRNILRVAVFSLGFGLLTGLDTALQLANVDARPEFLRMIPYLAIVVTLVLLGRDGKSPAALGQVYRGLAGRR
jgi:simple sugar transport system permease protein